MVKKRLQCLFKWNDVAVEHFLAGLEEGGVESRPLVVVEIIADGFVFVFPLFAVDRDPTDAKDE